MSSKEKEMPQQEIKRLRRELWDQKLKNEVFAEMLKIVDEEKGTSYRKKYFEKLSAAVKSGKKAKNDVRGSWSKPPGSVSGRASSS